MRTLLEFAQHKTTIQRIFEAFDFKDMHRALTLINTYLTKKLPDLVMFPSPDIYEEDGQKLTGVRWIDLKTYRQVRIGWLQEKSGPVNAYCVDFFADSQEFFEGSGTTALTVKTNGASVALVLPLIVEVVRTGVFKASTAIVKKLSGAVDESMITEENVLSDLSGELKGTGTVDDITFAQDVRTESHVSPDVRKADADLQKKREGQDPETAFKMMNEYLKLAVKGDRAGVILCGAPGVGKTFRVKKFLKSLRKPNGAPYTFADEGSDGDIHIMKGKGTARELYKYLYRTRERGKILMIDDADSILNDTEGCVNILKAAMEADERDETTGKVSDKGRLVSYAVSGKILDIDPEDSTRQIEVPKKIMYKGKVIIITNWPAGKLDTALRSRAYLQDIKFSTTDTLKIIRQVKIEKKGAGPLKPMLVIPNDYPISEEGEKKAMDYLDSLAAEGSDIELSFRTFDLCAGIFSVITGNEEQEELAKEMIKENMRLQFARGGKKY